MWERLAFQDHSYFKTEVGGKQEHTLHRNFAPKMYGTMENKKLKKNHVLLEQAASLSLLSDLSRDKTNRQSATWNARVLSRGACLKN